MTAGLWGNRLKIWPLEEFVDEGNPSARYVLRYLGSAGGAWCFYHLMVDQIPEYVKRIISEGGDPSLITVNLQAPPHLSTFNAEYLNEGKGYLFYSTAALPMREALRIYPQHTDGFRARCLLRHFLSPASYSDFEPILESYPDHVIEISAFSCHLGDLPGRNAIVWEVRQY